MYLSGGIEKKRDRRIEEKRTAGVCPEDRRIKGI